MSFGVEVPALSEKISIDEIPSIMSGRKLNIRCKDNQTYSFFIGDYLHKYLQYRGCVSCGLPIKFAQVRRAQSSSKAKLYFFGIRKGKTVLFTKDHYIPRARGGLNNSNNIQPMCTDCNGFKGDSLTMDPMMWALRKKIEFRSTTQRYIELYKSCIIDANTFARRMHCSLLGYEEIKRKALMLFDIRI